MTARTSYSPLTGSDIEDLVPVLHNEEVFAFLGGMPTRNDFTLGLRRAIAGPPEKSVHEHWINYGVRLAETGLNVRLRSPGFFPVVAAIALRPISFMPTSSRRRVAWSPKVW